MTQPLPPANPCTLCGENEAMLSLMSLADYTQVKACASCAPSFFRSFADDIENADADAPAEPVQAEVSFAGEREAFDPPADVITQQAKAAASRRGRKTAEQPETDGAA